MAVPGPKLASVEVTDDERLARAAWPRRRKTVRALRSGIIVACAGVLLALAGCSSHPQPSWASALGQGVTVVAPAQMAPGNGSPDAVVEGLFAALRAKRYTSVCAYVEPAVQATCKAGMAQETSATAPTIKNVAIGYAAIDGGEALVGTTGTLCAHPQKPACNSNSEPAAILSGGKPFSTLWSEQVKAGAANDVYMLAPCVKVGGSWYLFESSETRF
jgi:hypothetical protein